MTSKKQQLTEPLYSEISMEKWPIKMVKVSGIIENPDNLRICFDEKVMQKLAQSIKENGLAVPLIVHPAATGEKLELVDGHRRIRAVRNLKWDMIPVKIAPYRLSKEQVQEIMLITDEQHQHWTKYDHAKHCARVFQTAPSLTLAAERRAMDKTQFQYYLTVGMLDAAILEKATKNKIPFEFTAQSANLFATNALSKKISLSRSDICSLLMDKYLQGKIQPLTQFNACLSRIKNIPANDVKYWLQSENGISVLAAMVDANTDTKALTDNLVKSLGKIETKIRDNSDRLTEEDVQRIRNVMALIQRSFKHNSYVRRK